MEKSFTCKYCKKVKLGGEKTKVCYDCQKERTRKYSFKYNRKKRGKKISLDKLA